MTKEEKQGTLVTNLMFFYAMVFEVNMVDNL